MAETGEHLDELSMTDNPGLTAAMDAGVLAEQYIQEISDPKFYIGTYRGPSDIITRTTEFAGELIGGNVPTEEWGKKWMQRLEARNVMIDAAQELLRAHYGPEIEKILVETPGGELAKETLYFREAERSP